MPHLEHMMTDPNNKPEPTDEELDAAITDAHDTLKSLLSLFAIAKRMKYKHLNPDEEMSIDEAMETTDAVLDEMDYKRRQFYDKASKHVDFDWHPDDPDQKLK